jgi:hypothetical protein
MCLSLIQLLYYLYQKVFLFLEIDDFNNYNVIFKDMIFIYKMVDGHIAFFFA